MSNVLSEEKKQQVTALGRLGCSLRRIQKAVGVRRETASGYWKDAGIGVRPPGGCGWPAQAKASIEVTTGFGAQSEAVAPAAIERQPGRSPSASACAPDWEAIELGLSRGRNARAIWQDLVDQFHFAAGYQRVRRYVRHLEAQSAPEPRAVIEIAPGEDAPLDYADGPMVRDPQSGKYRRTRLFVFTLGFSRKSVRLLTFRSSSQIWAELHEKAFRRLGGSSRVVVLDNLREGVLSPDIYDPCSIRFIVMCWRTMGPLPCPAGYAIPIERAR